MRIALALLTASLAAACASGGGGMQDNPPERDYMRVEVPDHGTYRFEITRDDRVTTAWLPLDREQVWKHLLPTFGGLGLRAEQLGTYDPDRYQIAVENERVLELAGEPLSKFLRCGYSLTSPRADQGQVLITLAAWLESLEEGTVINVRLDGVARDRGASSALTRCTSSGDLEQLMVEEIVVRAMPEGG